MDTVDQQTQFTQPRLTQKFSGAHLRSSQHRKIEPWSKEKFDLDSPWLIRHRPGRIAKYFVSFAIVWVATGIQFLIWPLVNPAPYILYYPAVILAALIGDGWFALALSAVVAEYYFNPPYFEIDPTWPAGYTRMVVFVVSGTVIISLTKLAKMAQSRLFAERERSLAFAEQQYALAEISRAAVTAETLQDVYDTVVTRVSTVLKAEIAKILELKMATNTLLVRACAGCDQGVTGKHELPANRDTHAGYTLFADEPVISRDYRQEKRFAKATLLHTGPVRSGMAIPIDGHTLPYGVLIVHCSVVRDYTDDEKNFLSAVSDAIANTIDRRIAEESLRRSEEQLKRVNAELATAYNRLTGDAAELSRSNKELTRFAAIAAHDLKSPINSVAQFADLLREEYGPSLDLTAQEYFGFIENATGRMRRLIDRLLAYSRVGAKSEPFQEIDCNTLFDNVEADLKSEIKATHAVITSMQLPIVKGDEGELQQLFQNLIANALKFRGKDWPKIHVECVREGPVWRFSVSDNGIGIRAEDAKHIFEPFKRVHSGQYEGSGLGLAIAHRIVEHHGGKIWMDSEPGKGSTFYFTLPA